MSTPFWKSGLKDATDDIDTVIEIAGGLTAVAVSLRTSPQTVAAIRTAGRVTNTVFAIRMADLAAQHGRPDITIHRLSGMPEAPETADSDPTRGRKRPNGPSPRLVTPPGKPATDGGGNAGVTAHAKRRSRTSSRCEGTRRLVGTQAA